MPHDMAPLLDATVRLLKGLSDRLTTRLAALELRAAVPGPPGERGEKGIDGARGERGDAGLPGAKGEQGLPGAAGRDGQNGAPGLNGKDGAAGVNGHDGAVGAVGAKGLDGAPGRDGAPGLNGERGLPGADATIPRDWLPRLVALEARQADTVTDDELVSEVSTLIRRELLGGLQAVPTMQKRIIRDRAGKIERVIEEPSEAN